MDPAEWSTWKAELHPNQTGTLVRYWRARLWDGVWQYEERWSTLDQANQLASGGAPASAYQPDSLDLRPRTGHVSAHSTADMGSQMSQLSSGLQRMNVSNLSQGEPPESRHSHGRPSHGRPSHGRSSRGRSSNGRSSHDGPPHRGLPQRGHSHGGPSGTGPPGPSDIGYSHDGHSYGGYSYDGDSYGGYLHGGPLSGGPSQGGPSHGSPPSGAPPHSATDFRLIPASEHKRFFHKGRVVKCHWYEPLGEPLDADEYVTHTTARSTQPYNKVRIFVIYKRSKNHSLCVAIHTYNNQGCTKEGLNKALHVQAYTGEFAPPLLWGEHLAEPPVGIDLDNVTTDTIKTTSRIHVGRLYTVEHNLRFCSVGKVRDEDFRRLEFLVYSALAPSLAP